LESAVSKPRVLVVDIGGTSIKLKATGQEDVRKHPSGPDLKPQGLVDIVSQMTSDWEYDVVSIGYPGPVLGGRPACEPRNLGDGWVGFDLESAFGKPVKLVNDAAMQALGSYEGGRMLFLGLGTGLGTAIVSDGHVEPTELAHLPYRKGKTYEDYVGKRGFKRLGRKKWCEAVNDVVDRLERALRVDYVVIGGGQAKKLSELPPNARLGGNANAFLGGFRLWDEDGHRSAPPPAASARGAGRRGRGRPPAKTP